MKKNDIDFSKLDKYDKVKICAVRVFGWLCPKCNYYNLNESVNVIAIVKCDKCNEIFAGEFEIEK